MIQMQYLLDTNIMSRLLEGSGNVRARLDSLPAADRAITCTIVKGEMLFGIERLATGRKKALLTTIIDEAFKNIVCIDIPESAARPYANMKSVQFAAGKIVADNDLWIAATAVATGSVVVSHDDDMKRIIGLKLEDWW